MIRFVETGGTDAKSRTAPIVVPDRQPATLPTTAPDAPTARVKSTARKGLKAA